jgi:hypothetical protein
MSSEELNELRRAEADRVFEDFDFLDPVKDSAGWQSIDDEWSKKVFCEKDDGESSIVVFFIVRFKQRTAAIDTYYIGG